PGSVQGTFLVVDDVDAARAELAGFGADVSDVFHFAGGLDVVGTNGGYVVARERGKTPDEAAKDAALGREATAQGTRSFGRAKTTRRPTSIEAGRVVVCSPFANPSRPRFDRPRGVGRPQREASGAAEAMARATSSGFESIPTWLVATSTVRAPIFAAIARWR